MAKLLMQLNGSPDDEVEEIRILLNDNNIDFYETDAGRWGISVAGFWLKDESQWHNAITLLHDYQQQRSARVRAEFEELRQRNEHDTLLRRFLRNPLAMIFNLIILLVILYFSLFPFLDFS